MAEVTTGRRERKKARTRQAIASAALELFRERGFDQVTVRDVAEAADVSMSGLFKHFPTKESLVVDLSDDVLAGLVAAVRDRPTEVLAALRSWLGAYDRAGDPCAEIVAGSPALRDHARRAWLRHEGELADAIRAAGPDVPGADIAARAVARFALDRPDGSLDAAFALLANGWSAPGPPRAVAPPPATPTPDRPPGLRERKKVQTRQAITRSAVELFTERGYDDVGVREIADSAGVSLGTVFTYFPDGKASLVFPGDRAGRADELVRAVRSRPPGRTVPRALHDYMATRGPFATNPTADERRVLDLVRATPDLADYALRSWTAAQEPLAAAIAEEAGLPADDVGARLLAHYFLLIPDLASTMPDARHALEVVTDLLESGWPHSLRP